MILLDTHVLIWMDQDASELGSKARRRIARAANDGEVAVSAISFWEVAMLHAKGRIRLAIPVDRWRRDLLDAGLVELPVDGEAAIAAVSLPDLHPDPADRLVTATAQRTGATLLTADRRLLAWRGRLERRDARA
ncbi:MAG: type II toxin-antitoxin system VapC family toxin [Myxococcota bacterium]